MEYSGWITAGRAFSVTKLQTILQLYPNLISKWLLLGEGTIQENGLINRTNTPHQEYNNCNSKKIQIELLIENIKNAHWICSRPKKKY